MTLHKLLKADADEYSKELNQMKREITWHKYKDERPPRACYYLVSTEDGDIHMIEYTVGLSQFWRLDRIVKYWAELPQPPKENEQC